MSKRVGVVVLECLFDLGITVVYASLAGLVIVGIAASDDGPVSLLHVGLYALLLPAAVLVLISGEIASRLFKEWRLTRRATAASWGVDRDPDRAGMPSDRMTLPFGWPPSE